MVVQASFKPTKRFLANSLALTYNIPVTVISQVMTESGYFSHIVVSSTNNIFMEVYVNGGLILTDRNSPTSMSIDKQFQEKFISGDFVQVVLTNEDDEHTASANTRLEYEI